MAEELPPVCTPPKAGRMAASASSGEGRTWVSTASSSKPLSLSARLIGRAFERLVLDRRNLAGEKARCLRRDRTREALRGEGVYLSTRDLVLPREVLRGVAHGDIGGRVAQRFEEKILEIDAAHAEAVAHGVGGNRVAAHGLRADAQRELDLLVRDKIRRLHQHFEAGAA